MDGIMFEKKNDLYKVSSPSGLTSIFFGTFSRVIDFTCLGVAIPLLTVVVVQLRSSFHVRLPLALCVLSSPMTRLRQREELVELHLQGLPLNAIVRRTGHDHKTVQRWARRSLLRPRCWTGLALGAQRPA